MVLDAVVALLIGCGHNMLGHLNAVTWLVSTMVEVGRPSEPAI